MKAIRKWRELRVAIKEGASPRRNNLPLICIIIIFRSRVGDLSEEGRLLEVFIFTQGGGGGGR